MKYSLKTYYPYIINWALMTLILITIAALFGFVPFGNQTMLTIDLGQQYIDFFSQFRHTVLTDPSQFFYSFSKGIGGEMIGLWAYYLMSPFNLIFLFFNESNFHVAVSLISYLKLTAASIAMVYYIRSHYDLPSRNIQPFAIAYGLMSYLIVYLLNIMWLDGVILLPIIVVHLGRLVNGKPGWKYSLILAVTLIINYYIGYMICLFLAFYTFYLISERYPFQNGKQWLIQYSRFIIYSLLGTLTAGIMLLPTFLSLISSKASHASNEWTLDVAHSFSEIFSKIFIGAFEYEEIKAGSPNLYIGMFVLVLLIFYALNRHIHWQEKILALLVSGILIVSFRYEFLDKIWHGGQFPIWYHFRFSFVASFFMLSLAIKSYRMKPRYIHPTTSVTAIFVMTIICCYYFYINTFTYLKTETLFLSFALAIIYIVILQMTQLPRKIRDYCISVLVVFELIINANLVLSEFSYVQASKFEDYTQHLITATQPYQHDESDFYRIHKGFMRTKNESMYGHYSGLDHFSSTIEANVPELYRYLGQPSGSGFITYTNGSLLTDDLFNIRYLIQAHPEGNASIQTEQYALFPEAADADLAYYPKIASFARTEVYENTDRLGLGIEVDTAISNTTTRFVDNDPVYNQELLLKLMAFDTDTPDFFEPIPFDQRVYHEVNYTDQDEGDYYLYTAESDEENDSFVELHFTALGDDPYYFTMPAQLSNKNVELTLNGHPFRFYSPYKGRQIIPASYLNANGNQVLRVTLKDEELYANAFRLYRFDKNRYEALIQSKQSATFEIDNFSQTHIKGQITTQQPNSYLLFSIPYDANWTITLDGTNYKPQPVLNDTLMAIPVTAGYHEVELRFFPRGILYGSGLSVFGLIGLIACHQLDRKYLLD